MKLKKLDMFLARKHTVRRSQSGAPNENIVQNHLNIALLKDLNVVSLRSVIFRTHKLLCVTSIRGAEATEPEKFLMYTKKELNAIHVHGTKDTETGDKEN